MSRRWTTVVLVSLVLPSLGSADTFDDWAAFQAAVTEPLTTLDFEGFATRVGPEGAYLFNGSEFVGLNISGEDGGYAYIPTDKDRQLGFLPRSGEALLTPDGIGGGSTSDIVTVDFAPPTSAVGAYIIDAEHLGPFLEAFDGPGGTGVSLGRVDITILGNGLQLFAGVVATDIQSVVFYLGPDGVAVDDFVFTAVPEVGCVGFEPPMAGGPVSVRGNRALPLKAVLEDSDGLELTDLDLVAPPVLQVWYEYGTDDADDVTDEALPVGHGDEGNQFVFTADSKWQINIKTTNYTAAGTYTVFMESGDGSAYVIEPTCSAEFVIK